MEKCRSVFRSYEKQSYQCDTIIQKYLIGLRIELKAENEFQNIGSRDMTECDTITFHKRDPVCCPTWCLDMGKTSHGMVNRRTWHS